MGKADDRMVRIPELVKELDELAIVPLLLSFSIVGPLLHESFHGLWLGMAGCQYRQSYSFRNFHIAAMTEPLCFLDGWKFTGFALAGIVGSSLLSLILSALALSLPRPASTHFQAFLSGIHLSNAFSLLSSESDLALISAQQWSIPAAALLTATAVWLLVVSMKSKEII